MTKEQILEKHYKEMMAANPDEWLSWEVQHTESKDISCRAMDEWAAIQNKVFIDALKEELRKCDMMVNLTGERLKDLYDLRNEEKTEFITGTDLQIKETKVLNTTYTTFATTFKQLLASYAEQAPPVIEVDAITAFQKRFVVEHIPEYMQENFRFFSEGFKAAGSGQVTSKSAEGNTQHELAAALEDFIDEHEFLDGMKLAGAILDKCPHLFAITPSVAKDIRFLNELKSRIEKGRKDATQHEYAMQMVDDWLHELKSGEAGKQPIQRQYDQEVVYNLLRGNNITIDDAATVCDLLTEYFKGQK